MSTAGSACTFRRSGCGRWCGSNGPDYCAGWSTRYAWCSRATICSPSPSIRAFINQSDANARTRTIGNPAFAGTIAFFGHGSRDPHGAKSPAATAGEHGGHGGHEDVPRPPVPPGIQERFDLEMDITAALNRQSPDAADMTLKLVALNAAGNEVPAERLILEETVVEIE
jgi:hypothetical protein